MSKKQSSLCSGTRMYGGSDTNSSALTADDCAAWQAGFAAVSGHEAGFGCTQQDPCGCQASSVAALSSHENFWPVFVRCNGGRITKIIMSESRITGGLPTAWAALAELTHIDMSESPYLGNASHPATLPVEWAALTKLTSLVLQDAALSGTLPPEYSRLTALQHVNVIKNALRGPLPAAWSNMTELGGLFLSMNRFTGSLPPAWSGMHKIEVVEFAGMIDFNVDSDPNTSEGDDGTGLTGTLPAAWASLTRLQSLVGNGNKIEGSLPAEWAALTALRSLNLNDNQLAGSLPAEWARLTKLVSLQISNNELTGPLPAAWSAMQDELETVTLATNFLSGTLPPAWSNLTQLLDLFLNSNRLSGTLPPEWLSLTQLNQLHLRDNPDLFGDIPEVWPSNVATALKDVRSCPIHMGGSCEQINLAVSAASSTRFRRRLADYECTCALCDAGRVKAATGIEECTACPNGKFKAGAGSGTCQSCALGTSPVGAAADGTGAVDCIACGDPSWCIGGTECIASRRGTGCAECNTGYAQFQGRCTACPEGAEAMALPVALLLLVGIFMLRKVKAAMDAAIKHAVLEAAKDAVGVDEATVKQVERLEGRTGGSMDLMQQVAAIMTVLTFVQTSATLIEIDVGWPIEVKLFSAMASYIGSFDLISASAPECAVKISSSMRWALTLLTPLAPLMLLGVLILALKAAELPFCCCARVLERGDRDPCHCGRVTRVIEQAVGWLNSKALSIFLVTYALLVRSAFSPFDCIKVSGGNSYMRDSPDMVCDRHPGSTFSNANVTDAQSYIEHTSLDYDTRLAFGSTALAMCCLAIVLVAAKLCCSRRELHSSESTMHIYGMLYLRYEKRFYYWELLVLVRKFFLVFVTRVLSNDRPVQVAGCGALLGLALLMQWRCKPFLSDGLDRLEEVTLASCLAIVALAAGSLSGLAPLATTILYFGIVAVSTIFVAKALLAVWREGLDEEAEGHSPQATGRDSDYAGANVHADAVSTTSKKMVI